MALTRLHLQGNNYTTSRYMLRFHDEDMFDLDAPYQRGSVWTLEQRQALVKSLLMGLPIGAVVIAKLDYSTEKCYRVIDGKQRIETLRAFEANEFGCPRDWFEDDEVDPAFGYKADLVFWDDLSPYGRRHFEGIAFPSLEFESTYYHVKTDRTRPCGHCDGKGCYMRECKDGQVAVRYDVVHRTHEEQIAAEAEIFLLLNGGGTEQDPAHLEAVAEIASQS